MLQELVESVKKLTPGKATDPEEVSGRVYKRIYKLCEIISLNRFMWLEVNY